METAKKARGGKVPANGTRKVNAHLMNGNLIGQTAQNKWAKQPVWDVSFYNFQTEKWEPEGERRTYRQANSRARYLAEKYPHCKVSVLLVPGYSRVKQPVNESA